MTKLDRREFLRRSSLAGLATVVGTTLPVEKPSVIEKVEIEAGPEPEIPFSMLTGLPAVNDEAYGRMRDDLLKYRVRHRPGFSYMLTDLSS